MSAQADFLQHVRDALNHLHDYPHLETHPLALRCWPEARPEGPNRAQRLYRLLLESIESLNPPADSAQFPPQAEHYLLLVYRYVERREVAEITRELGYSRRQFFREQRKALLRLAALLWQRLPQSNPTPVHGDDLLSSEAERVLAQRETILLKEVVQGVLASVGALAEQYHVALESTLAVRLPPVYGNRTLLRQVLLKILSELITRPDIRRVCIQAQRSGRGVTVAVSGRAQPAVPAEACMSHEQEQALNTARRLVEMVGGQWLGYESDARDSVCRFSLPPDTQQVLLAVEDNEAVVRAFRRYLAGYGYQVVGATGGTEALRLAREVAPVAVALDVMMPTLDGWEVLQSLKNDSATRSIPVIICSVLDDPELAYSLGAAAYLHKPVTQADLLSALAALPGVEQPEEGRAIS